MRNNPTYIGELELSEDTLAHYGVKGMKWRRRKAKTKKKDPGIDTNRDPRFVRQGSGIANDSRYENKYSSNNERYYRAKTKRNKTTIKSLASQSNKERQDRINRLFGRKKK